MPAPGGGKGSLGAHQRQLEKTLGKPIKRPDAPEEMPKELRHVWEEYRAIEAGARTNGGSTLNPITWSEIGWWEHLMGVELEPWEVTVIRWLDDLFLEVFHDAMKR